MGQLTDNEATLSSLILQQRNEITKENIRFVGVVCFKSVFRIRIRIRFDPYHWAGSGSRSTSLNFDRIRVAKKNKCDKLTYKSIKIIGT